ncbi:hypothetical protein B4U79_10798 [Dinothrombium tinctorium]|uniref:Uncharacterized protein n=1 Tax=Dinothrombium tinctorium TaxID=1965070 RepID=A0A3S3Q1B2_9ACAR|nr:hypothetical protein B4U79_03337 [Dinothrombium tinctorium]RWS12035.1 hypothetical protein B4U79_10798 [Dinothrombium tinctorium]
MQTVAKPCLLYSKHYDSITRRAQSLQLYFKSLLSANKTKRVQIVPNIFHSRSLLLRMRTTRRSLDRFRRSVVRQRARL